jgi:sialidase-1
MISCGENHKEIKSNIELAHQVLFGSGEDGATCYRIPALVTATDGDLILAVDQRVPSCNDLRGNDNINIAVRRSTDNGSTWSPIEIIIDPPTGKSASDPSMIVDLITNEIFLFYNYMDLEEEKNVYYHHVIRSDDNGASWSDPEDITKQISKPGWHHDFKFITSGRGIQTADGTLLHCLVHLEEGVQLFGSRDHGQSWTMIGSAVAPADESKLAQLGDGRWMINSRVRDAGIRYIHISEDQGENWISFADSSLIDPACNASLISYSGLEQGHDKPVLLFSNAADSHQRSNMTIKYSLDGGDSWSAGKTIYSGSSAYSSMTILRNGDIGLAFEKDDYSKIVFTRVPLEWIIRDH